MADGAFVGGGTDSTPTVKVIPFPKRRFPVVSHHPKVTKRLKKEGSMRTKIFRKNVKKAGGLPPRPKPKLVLKRSAKSTVLGNPSIPGFGPRMKKVAPRRQRSYGALIMSHSTRDVPDSNGRKRAGSIDNLGQDGKALPNGGDQASTSFSFGTEDERKAIENPEVLPSSSDLYELPSVLEPVDDNNSYSSFSFGTGLRAPHALTSHGAPSHNSSLTGEGDPKGVYRLQSSSASTPIASFSETDANQSLFSFGCAHSGSMDIGSVATSPASIASPENTSTDTRQFYFPSSSSSSQTPTEFEDMSFTFGPPVTTEQGVESG